MQVIHTPGHAPDHICLVDEVAGILFAQDQATMDPADLREGLDIEAYARSMRRLADELIGSIRIVYTAHRLRSSAPPAAHRARRRWFEAVAAGKCRCGCADARRTGRRRRLRTSRSSSAARGSAPEAPPHYDASARPSSSKQPRQP